MEPTPEEIKARIKSTFNAASPLFDAPPLAFWNEVGTRAVELAGVEAGHRVLDVCCGSGASALPAAQKAEESGAVVGVDFAENLLQLGRDKAESLGLSNIEFVAGDMTDLQFESESFDVVVCVFGVFFAPDQVAALAGMWDKVAPGGWIAITVWGKRVVEPGNTVFWDCVETVRPDLVMRNPPWLRLSTPEGLTELFTSTGLPAPSVTAEQLVSNISAEEYWTVVRGSGYRGVIDQMSPSEVEQMKSSLIGRLTAENSGQMFSDIIYGRARRY